ncbi:cation:proton antiporter [Rhodohalobacter sp. SW132]|uniref:cation:proton antiporter domain-containing protein n=1 Tax=Rhodohalobacter sp. SW132 TaxID=2293433 RepID=UPI000E27478D|nr:cation:proton antiporter [Rhodohalobacter sp. SW132]REL33425.1 cation:proton antiporter [Rhodohalobacter sp. SW132]
MNDTLSFSLPFSDPVMIFALVMLIILLAPLIFNKLKIPGIVGLILSGTLVGPSILGLLERDSTIELLGTVGLLYLMFMAGLSIDLNRFEKLRNRSIGFGMISYLFPAAGAYVLGTQYLGYSASTSLLLGAIVGSHTLLAYPIVERLGITKNTAVTMSMGGTLVTDTLSLGILAVVAGTVGGAGGIGYWTGFVVSVSVFLISAVLILPRLGRWFFRNIKYQNNTDFVFMVAVLFTTAFLAELAGLASIIGAFIAGLLLNRLVPESGTLMSRIQFVGNALFIPFFLISVGMLVDVQVLTSYDVWEKAIAFFLLVIIGKGVASAIITGTYKYTKEEGFVIHGLTTPQSAATLAVTLLGYELGFFDQTAVNAVVILILFSCLFGPWLVEKYGRIVASQEEDKPYSPADAPQRILVPLANPETSDALMDIAFMVRDIKSGQPIYPLTVARDGVDVEGNVARSEKMLSHAVIHAASAEVTVNPITRIDLNIAKGIARAVEEKRITNIVIGWNGEVSTRRKIFGSVLDQLLEEVDEMVMVCKIEKPVNTFERLIVAVPPFASLEIGFPGTIRSLKLMAEQMGVDLVVISTEERNPYVEKGIAKVKPDVDVEFFKVSLWSDMTKWLDENLGENDLLSLVSAREGTISWRPGLDRLPRVISKRYPDLSFVTIYSSEVEEEADQGMGYNQNLEIVTGSRIKLDIENRDIESALATIITGDEIFENIAIERITRRLLENSSDYSPEVMPGVVFYESHTSKVDQQVLFIGISKDGINVENTANQAHVVLVLLSPKNMKVQDHIRMLNRISKLIRPGKDVESMKNAKDPREVVKALMAR